MKWRRWLTISVLITALAAGGCGPDATEIEPQQDQNDNAEDNQQQDNQNQDDNQNDDINEIANIGDNQDDNDDNDNQREEFADGADEWVGSTTHAEHDLPTPVELGDRFGGRFNVDGIHRFVVPVEGGEVLTLSLVDAEEGLEQQLGTMEARVAPDPGDDEFAAWFAPPPRRFHPSSHDQRQFFVDETAEIEIEVYAPGGDDNGFILQTETSELDSGAQLQPQDSTEGDLADAELDVYEMSADELTSVELEMFALREPTSSQLDGWVFIWNADDQQPVVDADAQSQSVFDPLVDFDLQPDTTYLVVADMLENVQDADYRIDTDMLDSSPGNRIELSTDAESSFDGTIRQREGAPHSDYFSVTVESGEFKTIGVDGHDELQPLLQLSEETDEQQGMFARPDAEALSVDHRAAATLGAGEEADDEVTVEIDITDQRNVYDEVDPFLGGDDYGYTIEVESADPDTETLSDGDTHTISLDSPGDVERIDVHVDDGHLLWLDGGFEPDIEEGASVLELDFLPTWAFSDVHTIDTPHVFDGYQWGFDETYEFLFRDYFFRGDDEDYETEVRVNIYDAESPDYDDNELADNNETPDTAASITTPASITGEYEEPDDSGPMDDPDPDDYEPEIYYFDIDAEEGDDIVVHTENDADNYTFLSIVDDDGESLADGSTYMQQRQSGSGDEVYYDGALVYEVEEDGSYILAVEQYCDQDWMFCTYGEVAVNVFVD